MDINGVFLFLAFVFCTIVVVRNEGERHRSNRLFKQRMKNLGFNVDGSRLHRADEILSTENQEVRSVLVGTWDGKSLTKQDDNEFGTLYRTENNSKFVRVKNSTAEPDGSFKTYWLRVPNHINTAKGAVAWTFGLDSNEYKPIIET